MIKYQYLFHIVLKSVETGIACFRYQFLIFSRSVNSLDYAEIDEELYGSLKRSSLFVKSIGADMDTLGLV